MRAVGRERHFFLAYLVLFFFGWWVRVLFPLEQQIAWPRPQEAARVALKILFWIAPVCVYIKRIDRRPIAEYLKLSTNWRRGLLWSLGLAAVVGPLWALGVTAMHLKRLDASGFSLKSVFEGLLTAALIEEITLRGFIVNKFAESFRFTTANLLGALFFVALHWQAWIFRPGASPIGLAKMSASIFLLSLVSGYLMRRTNSLWPSVTLHGVQNMIALLPS